PGGSPGRAACGRSAQTMRSNRRAGARAGAARGGELGPAAGSRAAREPGHAARGWPIIPSTTILTTERTMEALSKEAKQRLQAVSTATLSTLLFKRGLRNTWLHGVQRMSAAKANMVGEAFTLRN